jgi:hypothetical protein
VRRAALLVACVALAAGCRGPATRFPLPSDDPRPGELLRAWQAQTAERHALRGRASLAVDGDALRLRTRQILVVEKPSRMRVEVQGPLAQTVAVLVTDGPQYQLFQAGAGTVETGEVQPGLLWRVAGIALTPEQAIALVLGAPPLDQPLVPLRASATAQGEIEVELAGEAGRASYRLVFDTQARLRLFQRFKPWGSEVDWTASYDGYQPVAGVEFAHTIALTASAPRASAEIELSDVELNPELPADIFRLRRPGPPEAEGG